jgi:DNA-binding helix-hairpin-helix protein with protein kinase domain
MSLERGARVWAYTPPPLTFPDHPGNWEEVTLGQRFGDGGMALIHEKEPFPASRTLIKVFRWDLGQSTKADYYAKLTRIAERRIKLDSRIPVVAWPQALVLRTKTLSADALIGCLLPLVDRAQPLANFTADYQSLKDAFPNVTSDTQALIALNLVEALDLLHSREILFGDPNANNVLVDLDSFKVTLVDADSFAMTLTPPGGTADVFYPPPATTLGFRSPRVAVFANNSKAVTTYTEADDNYACAIHLFSLLVPGFLPWGDLSPEAELRSRARQFIYAGPSRTLPDDAYQMKLFTGLPMPMQQGFTDAFVHVTPPTPRQWRALFKAHWGHLRGQLSRRSAARRPLLAPV